MKSKTNWYWQKHVTKQSVIISNSTILHPCLEVSAIKMLQTFPGLYAIKKKAVQRQPIFIDDADHDYIIDKLERHDHIE